MGGAREASTHSKATSHAKEHAEHRARHHAKRRHKHRKRHHKHHHKHHHRKHLGTATPALPTAPAHPPAPSNAPVPAAAAPLSEPGAIRLLWRAGFGPRPGQVKTLVGRPVQEVVYEMTRPSGPATLTGPEPTVEENGEVLPLAPYDAWGQDHCWWLDRMIRSDQQLVEKMTLIWHDWFANSNDQVDSQRLMIEQNELFRSMALGSFQDLFLAVTTDPAMLLFLNGTSNSKWDINENYGREMMELFSLGADRGAYTETDVREQARALTGWRNDWSAELGNYNFRFDSEYHDEELKTIFGHTGNFDYKDSVSLCVNHPLHPSFFVTKLWGYFIPTPPDEQTLASLQGLYLSSGFSIRAIVEAILQHPDFYEGPELVTPPIVYNAGLMRASGRYVDTASWAWLDGNAGQQLFYPPNVSGWDYSHWLDTSTVKARWEIATSVTENNYPNPWPGKGESEYDPTEESAIALASAMAYWDNPALSAESLRCIATFAETCIGSELASWEESPYRAMRQNALRMLIATSPDMQVS
jgi:hypothetical protein